jgi:hypothetical protein
MTSPSSRRAGVVQGSDLTATGPEPSSGVGPALHRGEPTAPLRSYLGPRSGPADTDKAAMCGSAKNSSRSCTDNLLSAMAKSLAYPPTNSPVALSPPAAITLSIRSTSEQRAAPRFVHALG